jgi:hypothetical protein
MPLEPSRLFELLRHMGEPARLSAHTSAHQRKTLLSSLMAGAASVVWPCIAVMGLVPISV